MFKIRATVKKNQSVEINHNPNWPYTSDHPYNLNYSWFGIREN